MLTVSRGIQGLDRKVLTTSPINILGPRTVCLAPGSLSSRDSEGEAPAAPPGLAHPFGRSSGPAAPTGPSSHATLRPGSGCLGAAVSGGVSPPARAVCTESSEFAVHSCTRVLPERDYLGFIRIAGSLQPPPQHHPLHTHRGTASLYGQTALYVTLQCVP